ERRHTSLYLDPADVDACRQVSQRSTHLCVLPPTATHPPTVQQVEQCLRSHSLRESTINADPPPVLRTVQRRLRFSRVTFSPRRAAAELRCLGEDAHHLRGDVLVTLVDGFDESLALRGTLHLHQNVSAHGCNPSPSRRAPRPFMWYLLSPPLGQGTLVRVPYPFGSSEPLRRGPKLLGSHPVLPLPVARRHPLLDRRGTFSPAGVESPDVAPEAPLPELLRAVQQPHQ